MFDNPFLQGVYPNMQSKSPLVQLQANCSCFITCYLEEEANHQLATPSFQVFVESDKVSPETPLG